MSDVTQRKTAAGDAAAKQALNDRYQRWQASRGENPRIHVNYMTEESADRGTGRAFGVPERRSYNNFNPDEGDPKSAAHRVAAMFDDDESEWTV